MNVRLIRNSMRWKTTGFSDRSQLQRQWQETAAEEVDSDGVDMGRWECSESVSSIQKPPGHGANLIKSR